MKFPGIISFLENYSETISMSQNSGNFLQNGNTVHDVRMRQVMNIIHQRVNIHFAPKPSFFDPASNSTPDANQMRRTGYKNEFSVLCTRRLMASTSLSAKRTLPVFVPHEYSFCTKNPVFSIPRSNSTPDANQMLPTGYKNEFSVLCTRRLAASISRSAKRTPPNYFVPP